MRVALDATPLLGQRTGVGRYVAELIRALAADPDGPELTCVPVSWRGSPGLVSVVESLLGAPRATGRVRVSRRRSPARLMRAAWARGPLPPFEVLAGRHDIAHGTNFVLPPSAHARGVVTVHDLTYLHHPNWVNPAGRAYRELVPLALRRAAAVCVPSATVAGQLISAYRYDETRVVVTPMGVDPAWANARPPSPEWLAGRGLPTVYVLVVGTLEPRKGLDTLFGAYDVLHAEGVDVPELVLAGAAGWGPQIAPDRLAGGRLHLAGWCDDEDLRALVAGAACLAFPSREEGFGLPPLEALAAGIPVLASELPVCREVLARHAAYAPPDDPIGWAGALSALLGGPAPSSPDERRAHAAGFSWARTAQTTRAAYELALG